ncbi:alpha/beta hydrolase [Mycobacterium sp.]|uniref:alpha/beta hydrolase n=1 Tax=Mycobacterium sp. TaxID=1785 RepID=UPI003F7D8930
MKKQLAAAGFATLLCTNSLVEVSAAKATIQIPTIVCSTVHPDTATASDPRIQHIAVDGNPVSVLLPPQYGSSTRKYPVLYLLYGAENNVDSFLVRTNLVSVTSAFPDNQQFIVVTPSGGLTGFYVDWKDGSHNYETEIINRVIPAIDAQFRTLSDKGHRAVAGVSMGGFGAAHYGVKHPDLFGAVGTLSGGDDNQAPDEQAVIIGATVEQRECADGLKAGQYDPFGMFGDPVLDAGRWRAANPVANASQLRGMDIYLTSGNGSPCDAADAQTLATNPAAGGLESGTGQTTADLHLALRFAGVQHVYDPKPCGLHTWKYFTPEVTTYVNRLAKLFST